MKICAIFFCTWVMVTAAIYVNVSKSGNYLANLEDVPFFAVIRMLKRYLSEPKYAYGVIVSKNLVLVVSATAILCDHNIAKCDVLVQDKQIKYNVLESIVQNPNNRDEIGILRVETILFSNTVQSISMSHEDITTEPDRAAIYGYDVDGRVSFGFF